MIFGSSILELVLVVVVTAAPPLHIVPQNIELLNPNHLKEGKQLGIQHESHSTSDGDADANTPELQLENLKLNSNVSSTTFTTDGKSKHGKLNLETPTVSDNSHPELPSTPDSTKWFSISKINELEKKKDTRILSPLLRGMEKFSSNNNLKIETDYTPQDIAEYIFWTGDEHGVTEALNDFLREDLVGKDDVIKFLENVKIELKLLGNRFDAVTQSHIQGQEQQMQFNRKFKQEDDGTNPWRNKRIHETIGPILTNNNEEDVDYDELVQTMNAMNMKLREDSLRQIIYRLAKEVFSEKFGEHAIQRFVHFVQDATSSGHIPKNLEKEILDTMVSALVDALFEKDMNRRKGDINRGNQLETI